MSQYIIIFIWLLFTYVFAQYVDVEETVEEDGEKHTRLKWWYAFLVFLPVIIMAGRRGDIGDTYNYRMYFRNADITNLSSAIQFGLDQSKDQGFYILTGIIKLLIGNKDVVYFLILAFIQGIILVNVYREYSFDYFTSIFLFVASSDFISWMYNGIRQFMAVVIIFAATKLLLKKKYLWYFLVVLLASTMHKSALLMLPVALIVQGKPFNRRTLLFIILILLAVAFAGRFTNLLNDAMQETQYSNVVSDWQQGNDNGTNLIRVIVYAVPTILAFFGRGFINDENSRLINICTNMSIISTGLYFLSWATSGIFIGRLPIYCSLYNYILLPWELQNIFTERSSRLLYIIMIILYMIFFYYQVTVAWA